MLFYHIHAYRLRWQRENGLMNKFKRRWFPKKPLCDGGARDFRTVGLQEVKPALFFLLIGTAVSVLLMLIEVCAHMVVQRCNQTKSSQPQFIAKLNLKLR